MADEHPQKENSEWIKIGMARNYSRYPSRINIRAYFT